MDDVLKYFKEPVVKFFRSHGWEWMAENWPTLVDSGLFLLVAVSIWKLGKWGHKKYVQHQTKKQEEREAEEKEKKQLTILKDLFPYFSELQVNRSHELFIETKGQNVPPSKEKEPRRTHAHATKEPLIPKFVDHSFVQERDDERFYLVLADSGMGKTTFMINLYLRYLEKTQGKAFSIKLYPLSYPDIEGEIKKLVEKGEDKRTILLLDAFDEDREAAKNYQLRMDQIVQWVKNFREVVITSRTQFFPNEDAIPGEISVPKPDPDEPGYHRFKVMYLSPFDEEDIQEYLQKKFSGYSKENQEKRRKAQAIVQQSPELMVRPMLLANIDDLLEDEQRSYTYTHEIYEVLINKWLDREAGRKEKSRRAHFRKELSRCSAAIAMTIYNKWREEERLYLTPYELKKFSSEYEIDLNELDIRSRSLLNRDGPGNGKFSHKSILEYYLAKHALADEKFLHSLIKSEFKGMDMVQNFLKEFGVIHEMVRVDGGTFRLEGDGPEVTLSSFEIGKYPVTQAQWEAIMGSNPSRFKGVKDRPVESVSWEDVKEFIQKLNKQTGQNFCLPQKRSGSLQREEAMKVKALSMQGAMRSRKWPGTGKTQEISH